MNMAWQNVQMARAIVARANVRMASGGALLPRQVSRQDQVMNNQDLEMARAIVARANIRAATSGVLAAGTMRINGIAIDAAVTAADTASNVEATS